MSDTIFFWDTSSWDSTPTSRDGIAVFGSKLTDGDHFYANPSFVTKMNAMRSFGVDTFFAYHVLWGNASITNQAAWFLELLQTRLPWWDDPGVTFFVMSDDEPFGYNQAPTVSQVNSFHDAIVNQSQGKLGPWQQSGYMPQWHYGSAVSLLEYLWWQSNYGTNPVGHYPDVYPGNGSDRWNGPRHMDLLQYGSNTIIASQTTSDASAFRGTLSDFKSLLGGNVPTLDSTDLANIQTACLRAIADIYNRAAARSDSTGRNFSNDVWAVQLSGDGFPTTSGDTPIAGALKARFDAIDAQQAAMKAQLDAIQAALADAGAATGGTGTFTFTTVAPTP